MQKNKRTLSLDIMFKRRIGKDPHSNGKQTIACQGCPDIWELDDGNFAIIGIDITAEAKTHMPPTAGCGPDEQVVMIPRDLLTEAREKIPNL